jgi:non-ribosomal peptide synthetase-like protein
VEVFGRLFAPLPVSVKDHFFLDLGGHSLLATRAVSELRKEPGLGGLAVRDLYRHPTAEDLAGHVEERRQAAEADREAARQEHVYFHPVSRGAHLLCGLGQLAGLYLVLGLSSLQLLAPYLTYHGLLARGQPPWLALLLAPLSVVAVYPLLLALAVGLKWVVLGRFRAGQYRLWGLYFFRWWLVRAVLSAVPRRYLTGTPLLNLFYRLLGAKVGRGVYLGTDECLAFDLMEVGDDAHIGPDTLMTGCVVEGGMLKVGKITLGKRCFIGTRCALRPGAKVGDDGWLGDLSLVRSEGVVYPGKRRAGSPAVPVPAPESPPTPARTSRARRAAFGALCGLGLFLFPALIVTAVLPGLALLQALSGSLGLWYLAFTPLVALSFVGLFALEVVALKWLFVGRVRPGTHPLYGWHHFRKWLVDRLLDLGLEVLRPLFASLYQVPWYRLLGARIGRRSETSTATFLSPDLVSIGAESFVADNVALGAARVEAGVLTVTPVVIGTRTFVGNSAVVPAGTEVGDGCLVGCLSLAPPEARKPGTSWLGSPAFLLPRRQESARFSEEETFRPTRKLLVQRALVEGVRLVLPATCFLALSGLLLAAVVALGGVLAWWGVALLFPVLFGLCGLAACLVTAGLKWAVVGRYRRREAPLWSPFVWRSELITCLREALADVYLLRALQGTPWLCWLFRLLGARVGKRVFLDTTDITEFDLVDLGDDAALNNGCIVQTHLFEDRVMKMSHVRIGERCSVGAGALVLYDTDVKEEASLDDLSLLMKGEVLPARTAWTGIPAIPAREEQLTPMTFKAGPGV